MGASSFNLFRLAGDLLHVLSIMLLWTKIQKTRSCSGLSLKSQLLFLIVYVFRYLDLFVFIFHRIDLKHLYNFAMKCLFIASQSAVIYQMWYRYRPTYNAKLDTMRIEFLLLPCFVLGFFAMEHHTRAGFLYFVREVHTHMHMM